MAATEQGSRSEFGQTTTGKNVVRDVLPIVVGRVLMMPRDPQQASQEAEKAIAKAIRLHLS